MALSFVTYTGDGSNRIFNVTFQYLLQANVYVKVNNVAVTYTWLDSSRVQLTTAPASGAVVEVRRISNRATRVVDFQDGAVLTEAALDADSNQLFEMTQEAFDASDSAVKLDSDNLFNASNKRIKNVADPVNAQDAVTKTWAETAQTSQLNSGSFGNYQWRSTSCPRYNASWISNYQWCSTSYFSYCTENYSNNQGFRGQRVSDSFSN